MSAERKGIVAARSKHKARFIMSSYDQSGPRLRPNSLELSCPYCQARLSILPSQAGAATICPLCGGKFQAPLPTAQSPVGAPYYSQYYSQQDALVREFASKKIAAGVCGILLGALGVHKFILGFVGTGILMLLVSVFGLCLYALPTMVMGIIGLVEGIIYLTKSDEDFYRSYAIERRAWF